MGKERGKGTEKRQKRHILRKIMKRNRFGRSKKWESRFDEQLVQEEKRQKRTGMTSSLNGREEKGGTMGTVDRKNGGRNV